MADIFDEITIERAYQKEKWEGPKGGVYHTADEHDDLHCVEDFFKFIRWQTVKYEVEIDGDNPCEITARKRYIKIAALAVAAVESIDRRKENSDG